LRSLHARQHGYVGKQANDQGRWGECIHATISRGSWTVRKLHLEMCNFLRGEMCNC
jgi:hypothetical protein